MVKWIKENWLHLLTVGLSKLVEFLKNKNNSNK